MNPATLGRPIRVAAIDSHRFWIEMLADTFAQPETAGRFNLVGWATRLDEVGLLAAKGPADVVLVDFSLPDGHGTDAVPVLRRHWPRCRAVLFSGRDLAIVTQAALGVAIDAILAKTASKAQLLDIITRAAAGEFLIARELQEQLFARANGRRPPLLRLVQPLTPKERGVLEAYLWTGSVQRAAAALAISPATFRVHIHHILQKLNVHSRMEALTLALWAGLILAPDPLTSPEAPFAGAAAITRDDPVIGRGPGGDRHRDATVWAPGAGGPDNGAMPSQAQADAARHHDIDPPIGPIDDRRATGARGDARPAGCATSPANSAKAA